ncbi:LysR family transcriptional regulator [Pseudomonas sp. JQ170C]|uniref:LysR family transcriptional regulator n=1 Tax=Pseudomonas sp. JQ170C TaxID=3110111 RepID=UPI000FC019A8|nr:LysR family transcriptional regulator [Pseudomonas sp. 170C]WRO73772.1 LysR family transcriptional regulator [Pseudomonas sp. 170C]
MQCRITLKQLATFVAVADLGSVTRASKDLSLSQAAASMSLQDLEHQLGTRLFDRHGKRLVLNEHGRRFYPHAKSTLEGAQEAETLFQQQLTCHLRIGASTTIGAYLLPELLASFLAAEPQSRLELKVENTERIVESLCNFTIDVGFVEGPVQHPDIDVRPWREDDLVLIAAPGHPLTRLPRPDAQALASARWITREQGSGTRNMLEHLIGPWLGSPQQLLEVSNGEAIKRCVIAGAGIACVSRVMVGGELALGQLCTLPCPSGPLKRTLYRVIHKDKQPTRGLARFLEFCQSPVA